MYVEFFVKYMKLSIFHKVWETRLWNFLFENGILRFMYSIKISRYKKRHSVEKILYKIKFILNETMKSKSSAEIDRVLFEI